MTPRSALAFRPVLVAWLLAIGIDLFFNAGVFAGLFDQAREPALLPDGSLFARIPVAYGALVLGVVALAWLLDQTRQEGAREGLVLGVLMGAVLAVLGVVSLWTAIDMTPAFVAGAAAVQIVEFGAAGAFLGVYRTGEPRRLTRMGLLVALALAVAAIVAQNLIGS